MDRSPVELPMCSYEHSGYRPVRPKPFLPVVAPAPADRADGYPPSLPAVLPVKGVAPEGASEASLSRTEVLRRESQPTRHIRISSSEIAGSFSRIYYPFSR